MTLADLIPTLGGKPKPRKANRIETKLRKVEGELAAVRDDNAKLLTRQMAADDFFAILTYDRDEVYAAWRQEQQRREDAETVAACALERSEALAGEVAYLRDRFGQQLADEANAAAVDVPPGIRPIDGPEDEATGPINIKALWEARDAGLLGPVTDPGRVRAEGVA